jgi:hypothetical protein
MLWQDNTEFPWEPSDPAAEDCLTTMEAQVTAQGWTDEDFAAPAQALASILEQAWANLPTADAIAPEISVDVIACSLHDDTARNRMHQLPQQLLDNIFRNAQKVLNENLSLADQLVACVQDLLPEWGGEDLHVLARPLAYAMRDSETEMLEAALRKVRCVAWTELSGVEQARLSLAIARYALAQRPANLDTTTL